jgi:uncharacterized protein YlxW (UPF0749 family)
MPETTEEELARLRVEVESYRQRELADLRQQLAAAREAADHYRIEAKRIENNFHQLDAIDREKIAELESRIKVLRNVRGHAKAS